jgi:tetratricopeptide (TPR) repeat protein
VASLIRYKRAEKSNPLLDDLHNNLALLYADSGRLAAALATWQRGSTLHPQSALLQSTGQLLRQRLQHPSAPGGGGSIRSDDLPHQVRRHPFAPEGGSISGAHSTSAATAISKGPRQGPRQGPRHKASTKGRRPRHKASTKGREADDAQAGEDSAVSPNPEARNALKLMWEAALASHRKGDIAEAEPLYRALLKQDPVYHADLYNNLALLLASSGRGTEARTVFSRGVSMWPDSQLLQNNAQIIAHAPG